MARQYGAKRIRATTRDRRTLWFTADDRWSADPASAELIEDEAHADIRLLDAAYLGSDLGQVDLVDAATETAAP